MGQPSVNPYVGPRPFEQDERRWFFGRERELEDLLSLFLVDHCILFYAPSGAGKTSLLNTSLCPRLRAEGYEVLPVARVSGDYPEPRDAVKNIFSFNVIADLDQGASDPARLAPMSLSDYLFTYRQPTSAAPEGAVQRRVLIIDQFEELITTNQQDWEKRDDFFRQLRDALLADPQITRQRLWLLLAMREEHIADLDPYAPILPGALRTRFYMQPLKRPAALVAVSEPARRAERPFQPQAAEDLVTDLSRVYTPDVSGSVPGEFVEPLQLQVVCHQIWKELAWPGSEITIDDLRSASGQSLAASVDAALGRFYEATLRETFDAARTRGLVVYEDDLRAWFEQELITETQTRNMLRRGETETGSERNPLPNAVVDLLARTAIFHEVRRPGRTERWYELTHDRMIAPILESNRSWYEQHLVILQARQWRQAGHPANLLLRGELRHTAQEADWSGRSRLVEEFIAASEAEHRRREAEREAQVQATRQTQEAQWAIEQARLERLHAQRLRRYLATTVVAVIVALICAGLAVSAWRDAAAEAERANTEAERANIEARQANTALAWRVSGDAQKALENGKPLLRLLLAAEADELSARANAGTPGPEYHNALVKAVQETDGFPLRDPADAVVVLPDSPLLAAGPGGRWLAAVTTGGVVQLWDLGANQERAMVTLRPSGTGALKSIAVSADDRWLALGHAGGALELIDLTTPQRPGSTLLSISTSDLSALAFGPRSDLLAIGDRAGAIRLLTPGASPLAMLPPPSFILQGGVVQIVFSPDQRWLAAVDTTDTLWAWDLQADPAGEQKPLSRQKNGLLAFSSDSAWLAAAGMNSPDVTLWRLTSRERFELTHLLLASVRSLAFDPQAPRLAVGYDDGSILMWHVPEIPAAQPPAIPTYEAIETLSSSVTALSFGQPDRTWLASGYADNTVRIWDISTTPAGEAMTLSGHDAPIRGVWFDPDGSVLLTASSDGMLRRVDLNDTTASALGDLSDQALVKLARLKAGRELTPEERNTIYGLLDQEARQ